MASRPRRLELLEACPGFRAQTGQHLVKAVAGTITLIATITGTYLTYLAVRGNPPTTANWVRQANAYCDQDIGALSESLFNGLVPAPPGQQGSSVQSSQVSKVSALIGAVASLSKLVGDMAARLPHTRCGWRAWADVRRLLSVVLEMYMEMYIRRRKQQKFVHQTDAFCPRRP